MQRGMRGELISQPWFQPFRQSPDTFMTVSYIVVAVLALGLSYGGGLIGNVFTLALWAALAYIFFAIGSLRAHKLVAYGIGYGGAVIALIGILEPIKLIIDLSSYSVPSLSVGLVIDIVISVVVAALLGLFGVLVSKEIKRLSTNPF